MAEMNLYDLSVGPNERYDLAIFAGVLYHLRFPFLGLKLVADTVKLGGTMILETALLVTHHRFPFLYCPRPEDSPYEASSVTFYNHLALTAALESVGFVNSRCTSVIASSEGKVFTTKSWEEFLENHSSVASSDEILIGRGVYICERAHQDHDTALKRYWYGTHNINSKSEVRAAFSANLPAS
jgi:hypothetical protein